MSSLLAAAIVAMATYVTLQSFKAGLALNYARLFPAAEPSRGEGVAIAQAILSGDPLLEGSLRRNAEELSAAHFLWLVDTDDREGQAICRRLERELPGRIDVFTIEPAPPGVNPKLWKLEKVKDAFEEEVLVVLDDDTVLPPASLGVLVDGLLVGEAGRAEVTTGLPRYFDDGRWPSRLLCQFVANNAATTYLSLVDFVAPVTLNGMTWAIRKSSLAKFQLFGPILRCLTDDYAVARQVTAGGGRIEQSPLPQELQTTVEDGGHYLRLMHRWFLFALLLLRRQHPVFGATIGLLHGLPPLLLWAALVLFAASGSVNGAILTVVLLVMRAVQLISLQKKIYGERLYQPLFSEISELLQPLHLLHALLSRRIRWRKRVYQVVADDDFRPVDAEK